MWVRLSGFSMYTVWMWKVYNFLHLTLDKYTDPIEAFRHRSSIWLESFASIRQTLFSAVLLSSKMLRAAQFVFIVYLTKIARAYKKNVKNELFFAVTCYARDVSVLVAQNVLSSTCKLETMICPEIHCMSNNMKLIAWTRVWAVRHGMRGERYSSQETYTNSQVIARRL